MYSFQTGVLRREKEPPEPVFSGFRALLHADLVKSKAEGDISKALI